MINSGLWIHLAHMKVSYNSKQLHLFRQTDFVGLNCNYITYIFLTNSIRFFLNISFFWALS